MKKALCFVLAILIFPASAGAVSERPDKISAKQCVLMDGQSGRVLLQYGDNGSMLIASTTKLMTALVVAENCGADEEVEILPEYTAIEGSAMYLRAGERLTVRELLYGLLLLSGNDAAVALACHAAGSVENFAQLMNEKALELGLWNTHFVNPHGLDAESHYSCARDLAVIAAQLMRVRLLSEIVGTKTASIAGRAMRNHNKLLWNYQGALGLKTGYTEHAGRSLVSCAERNGVRLICVTLNDPNDWADHTALLDWGFENYKERVVADSAAAYASVPVISGTVSEISVRPAETLLAALSELEQAETEIELPSFVYAPVAEHETIGRITVKVNGAVLCSTELVAASAAEADPSAPLNFWERLRRNFKIVNGYGCGRFGVYYVY